MFSFKNNDPIVVSGISGKVPNADNISQFQEQIYNKMNMTTRNHKRYPQMPEVPERVGVIPDIDKFDNGFFGVPQREVDYMSPSNRMLLENVCEALTDAGLSLREIKGSRTGLYFANSQSESEAMCYNDTPPQSFALKGSMRTVTPLQLSHYLEIDGPSYVSDAACSSSLHAVEHSINDLERGKIDYAIICASNLILSANVSRLIYRLGTLSPDGRCKSFDDSANGYARSDGNLCMILQRGSTAKRNYADIVHCRVNCDGFKEVGIVSPSSDTQEMLLSDFYSECKIPFEKIGYVETHGTGTAVGDPLELQAIADVYCKTRKQPLLIGSVKSNLGHIEGGSALASIFKVCMIFETGIIPPNIHFHTPNTKVEGLKNGKLVVVTENTPLPGDQPYVAVSNHGFGGANGHVLLKRPIIKRPKVDEELPRLLCIGGRTREAVKTIFEDVKARPYDPDYVALLNASFNDNIPSYYDRGFAIIKKSGVEVIDLLNYTDDLPLKCIFQTDGIIRVALLLLKFVPFQDHLEQVQSVLKQNNIAWDFSSLRSCTYNSVDNILTTIIVQTGIIHLLKVLNIEIAEFAGSGFGEISASYADGLIQLDQALLVACHITKLLHENKEVNIIKELKNVCNVVRNPSKWAIQNNNWAQDLAEIAFMPKAPIIAKENLLIIGGNAANSSNIVSLCDKDAGQGFLHSLGRLYLLGYAMAINPLYGVTWPVHQGTPMISPQIKWRHNKTWTHIQFKKDRKLHQIYSIKSNNPNWQNIDGKMTFPSSGYIFMVLTIYEGNPERPIFFENIKFLRTCTLPQAGDFNLCIQISKKTGYFEVSEGDTLVVTGFIYEDSDYKNEWIHLDPLPTPKPEDMLSKEDVYKELALRGYYYHGDYLLIQNWDINATVANIKWTKWIPFIETMLLFKILQKDTRSLFVPTKISKLTIYPKRHFEIVDSSGDRENCVLPVYHYQDLDMIRCGRIEIRGLATSSIVRREHPVPILEAYKFVPYIANLDLQLAARIVTQIALENNYTIKMKALEVFKDVAHTMEPLLPYIRNAVNDQPIIQLESIMITNKQIELDNITVVDKTASSEVDHLIAVGSNLSQNSELRKTLTSTLKSGGFLISRESLQSDFGHFPGFTTICEYTTPTERVFLLKVADKMIRPKLINVSENGFKWLSPLKEAHRNKENILLYSENEPNNGILGLTNCLLRESGRENIMNVLIDYKSAPRFDLGSDFYKKQLKKNLTCNVYKNGTWGSYRHVFLADNDRVRTVHSYVSNTMVGDLSSLCWLQRNLSIPDIYNPETPGVSLVHVYVGSLNLRDVMVVTGKIRMESITKDRKCHESCLGVEFAARKETGERVMGMTPGGAFATVLRVSDNYLWKIPDNWTMEEGATVPVVYSTLLYGLIMRANMVEGESILIHAATGDMGLSAINIALYYKCNIFLTVETQEKLDFILKTFPQIPAHNIGNSTDTNYYEMILKQTAGKGVDLILNSFAEEKLQASVKCLGVGGRFIAIGNFDFDEHSLFSFELAERQAEYHGVLLDYHMSDPGNVHDVIWNLLNDGIDKGFIKPIPKTCFARDELEKAFRYMTTGKHIGKLLISMREEEENKLAVPKQIVTNAKPRFYCKPKGCYIIVGGLGGFGLELADFLAIRGAKNIVLVSRKGLSTGYQKLRLKILKSYGCKIQISNQDISNVEGCEALLNMAQQIEDIIGIFNLAVVLRDAVFENQTEENFQESYIPKAQATIFMDQLSRKMTPKLEHFVAFSSVVCRGYGGLTTYGYSNSVIERVCENRVKDGLPGKAIQWGPVADVGVIGDSKERHVEIHFGGCMQQRIANCLEVLDILLLTDDAICCSMVVAKKKSEETGDNLIKVVLDLLDIKDITSISPNSKFSELGMDSLAEVELKQTLEKEFNICLSPQELRKMNFAKLNEIVSGGSEEEEATTSPEAAHANVSPLMRFIPTEEQCDIPVVTLKTGATDSSECSLYLLSGLEGMSTVFEPMAKHLSVNTKCLQFAYNETENTIKGMAFQKVKILEKEFKQNRPFTIVAHSLGATVALEILTMLEDMGYKGTLVIVEGSPLFNRQLITSTIQTTKEDTLQISLIANIMSSVLPPDVIGKIKEALSDSKSFEERCTIAIESSSNKLSYSNKFLRNLLISIYKRVNAELMHNFAPRKYKSRIVLCKASISSLPGIPEDYGLHELLKNNLEIHQFQGDHISILSNADFIKFVEMSVKSG